VKKEEEGNERERGEDEGRSGGRGRGLRTGSEEKGLSFLYINFHDMGKE